MKSLLAAYILMPFFFIAGCAISFLCRYLYTMKQPKPRLVWGSTPLINYVYWSRAMKHAGFFSQTFTYDPYPKFIENEWDVILSKKYGNIPIFAKMILAFFEAMTRYDVFFLSFDGFFLGSTPYWWMEGIFLKLAKKKTVLIPYGSDAYVYREIRSVNLIHGLLLSYPQHAKRQEKIARRVSYWCSKADVVIPGFMGPDGFGRWDVLVPSPLCIDTTAWHPSVKRNFADGKTGTVFIAHAPNHRGCKGTEFILEAIQSLKAEGLSVELILIEKKKNSEVKSILQNQADILVDQLILPGYAMNALEGLACGLPVVCNLDDDSLQLFRRWSYLSECPIVSANPETIVNVLRRLVVSPKIREQLGKASREYVEKYHSLESAQYMFSMVIDYLYGRIDYQTLINLYNPRISEYCRRRTKLDTPSDNES